MTKQNIDLSAITLDVITDLVADKVVAKMLEAGTISTSADVEDDEEEEDEVEEVTPVKTTKKSKKKKVVEPEPVDEDDDEEDDDEEEEDEDDSEMNMTIPQLKKIIKDENLKIRVTKDMKQATVWTLILNKRIKLEQEKSGDDEKTKLLKFAEDLELDDINPDLDVDEIRAELCEYALDEDDLTEDEIAFINENDLEEMLEDDDEE